MTTILANLSVERMGWVLVHSLWQFLAIALVVRLFEWTFAGRLSAAARYIAGLCGVAAMTAAPVVTWFALSAAPFAFDRSAAPDSVTTRATAAANSVFTAADPQSLTHEATDRPRAEPSLVHAWTAGRHLLAERLCPWLPMLVSCWMAGVSVCSLRPLVGWLTVRRLRTVGVSAVEQVIAETTRKVATRLGVTRTVSVLKSSRANSPLVVGFLRPVLLVPLGMASQLPVAELEAILAHELAHIRRHDFLVNLWQVSLETVFFYHPAVWSLSRRLRLAREHCCDDAALSIVGDPACYGRALLHVEELRGLESVFALGAGGGLLKNRIQRLFGQPAKPIRSAGLLAGVLLPSVTLASVLAAFAWGASSDFDGQLETFDEPSQREPQAPAAQGMPAVAARSLDIVIAQHVLLWDGRIRAWDEVVTELREIRKAQGKPIHPNFYFTNGAHSAGHWDTYKAKVFEIYKELFEPTGISLGSISPRAGPRYDALRTANDLVPDPKSLRSGVVVEKGKPKAGVLVLLVPENGVMPVMLKSNLALRDPLDEVWTLTDPDGRFVLPIAPVQAQDANNQPRSFAIAAITPSAYRLASIPAEGQMATIELASLAQVELVPVEGKAQRIDLAFRGGLSDASPGFSIYEIELRDKPLAFHLPPGKVTIRRSFQHQDGGARSYPAELVEIGPGVSHKVSLPNITEQEAERNWIEESVRPKGKLK